MDLHVVVMAGGSGERLWPQSRRRRPKPLLPVAGGATLLAATLARAAQMTAPDRIWIVCTADHAAAIRAASGLPHGRVLVEPRARNTAMAVGYAAAHIARRFPDAVLAMLPADHMIPDGRAFAKAMRRAARAAEHADVLVTLGVAPTRAETGYGYLHVGEPVTGRHAAGLHRLRGFAEKPSAARARRYVADGGWLWNAGIFAWRAATILDEIERYEPALGRALAPLRHPRRHRTGGSGAAARARVERAYRRAPSLPIDVAVLERSDRVWTLPIYFHWNDLGSWASLAQELGVRANTSRVVAGDAWLEAAPGNLVWGAKRPIALVGVEGLAVIDTGDALLVTRLDRSEEVRRLVARLREARRTDLL
ncbi:mannose-1-phosphate guanylyltransferase [Myxococcota bacterium]|nr:mannose-1-phosphate guanylyltransferase [Myxococcota bacterium]